jgi:hypothetical protein
MEIDKPLPARMISGEHEPRAGQPSAGWPTEEELRHAGQKPYLRERGSGPARS